MECGYIEEGVKTKRPQVCPDCGAPGQALEFFPYGDDDLEDWDDSGPDIEVRAGVDSPGDVFDDEVEHLR